ncbi:TetR/AcrR family transcriptional regulator [Paludibacteraceae bacterium OttesenSCG-928-F17]|nr:TetR/AcrR family transcriptional regulator [Paludibacteraceae bacterium OttesenSCG-928-F17]
MQINKQTTEDQILIAAEQVFQSKGYQKAKISDIAAAAGVNNALINYYFRSKENLFNKVLHNKIELLANSLKDIVNQNKSFLDTIKDLIETQFDFFKENEKLPRFILSEVFTDQEKADIFGNKIIPAIMDVCGQFEVLLQKEIKKGTVRNIKMADLFYLIISLNVVCFIISPILQDGESGVVNDSLSQLTDNRKSKNVEIVMNYLKI